MFMSPKTSVTGAGSEALAEICCLSKSTTYHWFGVRTSHKWEPVRPYQKILAIADFLLANADKFIPLLERWQQQWLDELEEPGRTISPR